MYQRMVRRVEIEVTFHHKRNRKRSLQFMDLIEAFPIRDFRLIWQLPNCQIVIFVDACEI